MNNLMANKKGHGRLWPLLILANRKKIAPLDPSYRPGCSLGITKSFSSTGTFCCTCSI